jgi:formylglycine-generating enzyme
MSSVTAARPLIIYIFISLVISGYSYAAKIPAKFTLPSGIVELESHYHSNKDNMAMVFVPASNFLMGSSAAHFNERPQRKIFISGFLIDRNEVTNTQYSNFIKSSGHRSQGPWKRGYGKGQDQFPVRFITWHDASAYAEWAGKRLPTEAEWEKAARGLKGFKYPWGNSWNQDNINSTINAVNLSSKVQTPFGALNMAGNVWEWVYDWYDRYYYKNSTIMRDPKGPEDGATPEQRFLDSQTAAGNERSTLKVIKGGGTFGPVPHESARSSKRVWGNPNYWFNDTGFRCVISVGNNQ